MALIGLLPGTFDPIHSGHVALAQAARKAGELDEVWLLVDAQPVHKPNVLSYEQRFEMAVLATAGVEGVSTTAVPEQWRRVPHTMAGFEAILKQRSQDRFVFIVGLDTLVRLDSWEDAAHIVASAAFLVAHRPGVPVEAVEALRERLGGLGHQLKVQLFEFDDHSVAASTTIRRELAAGHKPAALAPAVWRYITDHGLYQ